MIPLRISHLRNLKALEMPLLNKINKRSHYPIKFPDGDIYVRAMTYGEIKRMKSVSDDLRTPFVMGVCLVNDDGSPETPKKADETDEQFAQRVDEVLDKCDVDTDRINQITRTIGKIGTSDAEAVIKN